MLSFYLSTFGFIALGLIVTMEIYKRSVSTTIAVVAITFMVNLNYYGYTEWCVAVVVASVAFLIYRASFKPKNDKFFYEPVKGKKTSVHKSIGNKL